MTEHSKPRIVVSRCLGSDVCRYDGEAITFDFVRALEPHVRLVKLCPEVEIGLGTPRPPIQIEIRDGERRLIQPSTGLDLTDRMIAWRETTLDSLAQPDGFILKSRSPTCGIADTKVFSAGGERRLGRGPGMFAEAVLARFPDAAVEGT